MKLTSVRFIRSPMAESNTYYLMKIVLRLADNFAKINRKLSEITCYEWKM